MTLPTLNLSSWAGLAAAAAILGTFWRTIYEWGKRAMDLVICRVVLKEETARAVMSSAWRHGKRSPFGLRLYGGVPTYVFPKRRVEVVSYEGVSSEPLLFWFGRAPVLVGCGLTGQDSPNIGDSSGDAMPVTLRYLRGTIDIDAFIESAVVEYNTLRQVATEGSTPKPRRFSVTRMCGRAGEQQGNSRIEVGKAPDRAYSSRDDKVTQMRRKELRLLTWQVDDLIERSTDAPPFTNHPVAPEVLAEFDEVYTWIAREQWFRSKGVPWRRGYLLVSAPGGGKDTLVRNLAIRHDLPIYAFDLSTYDNRSFTDDWKQVMQNAPAIALCSDIDTVWKGRENIAVKGKTRDGLTFDCFLNTISGVGSSEGVLLFVTTNHLENLDPALGIPTNGGTNSTRPGRIDRVVRVGPMAEPERRKLAELILSDWPEVINDTVAAGDGEMAAQFQERCVRIATERFWTDGVKGPIEPPPPRALTPEEVAAAASAEEDRLLNRIFNLINANAIDNIDS